MSKKAKRVKADSAVPPKRPSRKTISPTLLAGAALICLALLAFSNSFTTGLVLDSRMLVLGDPRIRELAPGNLGLIFQHTYWWPNGEAGIYRPLTTLSYLFNYAVLGNNDAPAGYHLINFLLHAVNVLLVFALCRKLLTGRASLRTCIVIAGTWAVHPVLTESVTNVAGRADLLAAMGVLSGFLMYLKASDATGRERIGWLAGLALATLIGVFSKESAAVLPGVVLLYEFLFQKPANPAGPSRWQAAGPGLVAILLPIAVMILVRTLVLANSPRAEWPFVDNPIAGAGFSVGRLTALKVLARYLAIALWPSRLSADYSYSQIPLATGTVSDWLAWISVGVAAVAVALLYRQNKPAFFFACFAFLSLLPGSNLLFPIGTIMGERLLYLPLVGIIGCSVVLVEQGAAKWNVPAPVLMSAWALIAAALCVRTFVRNRDWVSDRTMAAASVLTSPESFKVHRLLAAEILESDPSEPGVKRAAAQADRSVSILRDLPDRLSVPDPWTLAANCHLAKGNLLTGESARREYQTAVKLADRSIAIDTASRAAYGRSTREQVGTPASAGDPHRIMAAAYLRLQQPQLALQAGLKARAIDPRNPDIYRQLAEAYADNQKLEDAAITLAEGAFATGSEELREDLIKLYQQGGLDTQHCAVVAGPRGPALNPACEIVRRDLCEATARAHRPDLRQQLSCPN